MNSAQPMRDPDTQPAPYLRVLADSPDRETRPDLRLILGAQDGPSRKERRHGGFAGVSWTLWGVFLLSVCLLAAVRTYVRHAETRWTELASLQGGLPQMQIDASSTWMPVERLRLSWDRVPDTYLYKIKISTISGRLVVDGLPVETTSWSPPPDLLPALGRGEYLWQVTAVGSDEKPIARSAETVIRLID
jgi:hypothetical protein